MASILELVGGKIKDIRKDRRLSQDQLGERCGFHFSYIGGVERGERNVSLENLAKIAEALHVELKELFNFKQDSNSEKEAALKEVISLLQSQDIKQIIMTKNLLLEILAAYSNK
ncbi:helix-turn-helix domain-containing protein [Paenibacillus sp. R14(2021)]|uniref:helix-turn-helix domain-containing protein n=1 Tax=Paenibacillus sp. R14(2021) TaxID=2859228 RepID=UPI001C611A5B|nr:helix-turn-helix transcriptional regulator [Paenibacillus sp. R14(2021)]